MIRPVRKRMRDVLMDPGYSEYNQYTIVDGEKTSLVKIELEKDVVEKIEKLVKIGLYSSIEEFVIDAEAHYLRWLLDHGPRH
jgi:hypothetical protein